MMCVPLLLFERNSEAVSNVLLDNVLADGKQSKCKGACFLSYFLNRSFFFAFQYLTSLGMLSLESCNINLSDVHSQGMYRTVNN